MKTAASGVSINAEPAITGGQAPGPLRRAHDLKSTPTRFTPPHSSPPAMQPKPLVNNWPERIDYSKQTVEVPGSKKPGETRASASDPHLARCFSNSRALDANSCVSWW